jgi:aspartate 1-decarboxylase
MTPEEAKTHQPTVVLVDAANRITSVTRGITAG